MYDPKLIMLSITFWLDICEQAHVCFYIPSREGIISCCCLSVSSLIQFVWLKAFQQVLLYKWEHQHVLLEFSCRDKLKQRGPPHATRPHQHQCSKLGVHTHNLLHRHWVAWREIHKPTSLWGKHFGTLGVFLIDPRALTCSECPEMVKYTVADSWNGSIMMKNYNWLIHKTHKCFRKRWISKSFSVVSMATETTHQTMWLQFLKDQGEWIISGTLY